MAPWLQQPHPSINGPMDSIDICIILRGGPIFGPHLVSMIAVLVVVVSVSAVSCKSSC